MRGQGTTRHAAARACAMGNASRCLENRVNQSAILSATGNPQGSMGSLENEASPHSPRRYERLEECEWLLLPPGSGPLVWTFTTLRGFTVR